MINDEFLQVATDTRMAHLLPLIGSEFSRKNGLPFTHQFSPRPNYRESPCSSRNLIDMVGPGTEPLDALAESYPIGSITRTKPLQSVRKYLWCYHDAETLKISCPNEILGVHLESKAREEAKRRVLLGLSGANKYRH